MLESKNQTENLIVVCCSVFALKRSHIIYFLCVNFTNEHEVNTQTTHVHRHFQTNFKADLHTYLVCKMQKLTELSSNFAYVTHLVYE